VPVILKHTKEMWAHWREPRKGPLRWLRSWSTSHAREVCESWDCLAWRRDSAGESHKCVQIPEGRVQRGSSQALSSDAQ